MSDHYIYCGLGRGQRREENSSFGKGLASLESHSMDFDDEGQNNNVGCICKRPIMTVFCRTCAYVGKGRLKITCSVHPRNLMLMDMVCCPTCRTSISNMKEFNSEKIPVPTNNPSMETTGVSNMQEFNSDKISVQTKNPMMETTSISDVQELNSEKISEKTNNPSKETKGHPLNSYSHLIPELENRPLYGIGRGISPMNRSSHHPIGSSQTFTPGMSPLRRASQSSNLFSRFQFPSGNAVRRPGLFREN